MDVDEYDGDQEMDVDEDDESDQETDVDDYVGEKEEVAVDGERKTKLRSRKTSKFIKLFFIL